MSLKDFGPVPPGLVTRFAPSPTGHLHLGHAANAVWTWGLAQATGGTVRLRIEDHDRGRSRPEFEASIRSDLAWLGLAAPDTPVHRQSDDPSPYRAAVDHLAATGLVFGCRCSRADIARRLAEDGLAESDELRYPGTCRGLGLPDRPGTALRVRLGDATVGFTDLRLGPQVQQPARQCGDLLLRDTTGHWTYQLCVVVDDFRQGVELVVRGEDLLASTGRQIMLAGLLGRAEPPRFLHHPLIQGDDGTKLSKRDGATGLRELRAAGTAPERVLGLAAWRTGLLDRAEDVPATELGALFTGRLRAPAGSRAASPSGESPAT